MAAVSAPTLASETIAMIGSFEIRNTLLMAWIAVLVLIFVALCTRLTKYKQIPGRFQALMELIIEGFFGFWDSIVGDPKETRKFFPLVTTIFIFLAVANWMGIFPGVGSIVLHTVEEGRALDVPLLRSMNADVNMTLAVALISVIMTQVFGVLALGPAAFAGKYFVAPWRDPIGCFIGLLELVAECAKVISFTFRLFGNIFAGEVLLVVISFLLPFFGPIPFLGLEIFVGFIQALVFSLLTLVFVKMATMAHGGHEEEPVAATLRVEGAAH